MPKIIFKCDYIQGGRRGAKHLRNMVSYVATRDGVDTNTQKRDNYVNYIANRPHAEKIGEHGLFSGTDDVIHLSAVANEVAGHEGYVWLPIISLTREDAVRLGYDNAVQWRDFLRSYATEIADGLKIPHDNFKWYAAYHNHETHPHVHMVCWSAKPREGYRTEKGIADIKSRLAKQIFRQDLIQIYSEQTEQRDMLNRESLSVMREMCGKMREGISENPVIAEKLELLSKRLENTSGKKVYGYLKADVKAIVDSIVDELAKDPRVAKYYDAWYETRDEILSTYSDNPAERVPLSRQNEFKPVRNMVIKEALRFGSVDIPEPQNDEPDCVDMPDAGEQFLVPPDDEPEYNADWTDGYKLARDCLFGGEDMPPDFAQAHELLLLEAESGSALAMHDLGRMYADGLGCGADTDTANEWYSKALTGFLVVESKKSSPYIQYRIGKMYAAGLGTKQDYVQAADWFGKAAAENHNMRMANTSLPLYSLGGLYYRGQGVAQDFEKAFELYKKSAEKGNVYAAYELAKMLRDGIGVEANPQEAVAQFKTAFSGFVSIENKSPDDKLQYRIGQMLRDGVGTDKDEDRAAGYLERSAKLGNPYAQFALAKLYLKNSDEPEKINLALEYLHKCAGDGNAAAQYTLGKLYRDGTHVEKDISRAVEFFTESAGQDNEFAQYALGKLYLSDEAAVKDISAAVYWLTKSALQGNQFAQYALGKLFLPGENLPQSVPTALHWLNESAGQGNQFAQYQLGKTYLMGKDVPCDREQALYWLTLSAGQGNEYAQFFLDHFDKFQDPSVALMVTRLMRQLEEVFNDQNRKLTARADGIDSKRARELREKKQAQGHTRDDQIQNI